MLERYANVDLSFGMTPEQLLEKIPTADALIVRSATKVGAAAALQPWCSSAAPRWVQRAGGQGGRGGQVTLAPSGAVPTLWPPRCVVLIPQVTRAVFEASRGRLQVVGRAGVGVDNVDLAAATEVRP